MNNEPYARNALRAYKKQNQTILQTTSKHRNATGIKTKKHRNSETGEAHKPPLP